MAATREMVMLSMGYSGLVGVHTSPLDILGFFFHACRRVLVSLAPGFIGRLKLITLLVQVVASTVHPIGCLLARFPRTVSHEISSFFSLFPDCLADLRSRFRGV